MINLKDYGAVGDGSADDTVALVAAIAAIDASPRERTLYIESGTYRLTSPIVIKHSITIIGEGCCPYEGTPNYPDVTYRKGSWLWFDHIGQGLIFANNGSEISGIFIEKIGTQRNQPYPTDNTWVPIDYDFDIYFEHCDAILKDILLLNPTRGIKHYGGSLNCDNFMAYPFKTGVQIDQAYDICRFNNVHIWPYWVNNDFVMNYTMANREMFVFYRVDNPTISNFYTIWDKVSIALKANADGNLHKLHMTNVDMDLGVNGIVFDPTVRDSLIQGSNITIQGRPGVTVVNDGITIDGMYNWVQLCNLQIFNFNGNGIKVLGSNNHIRLANSLVYQINQASNGSKDYNIVDPNVGNTLTHI